MKVIDFGQRYIFSADKAWSKVKVLTKYFYSIYDQREFADNCVRAIESAEDEVML